MSKNVSQILTEGRHSLEVLGLKYRHAAWIGLKQSVWQRFEYWCQNCYPSLTLPPAHRLDRGLYSLLEMVVGLEIPLGAHQDTIVINSPVASREGWSFPAWVLRQPIKCGGAGLRSFTELCRPAFVGALELAIPSLHTGFCPILTPLVGGEEHFGDGWEGRWRPLLDSGCRAGRELASAWDWLQQETAAAKAYLGEAGGETIGPLCQPVESAGEGCTTGKTRTKLVEEREVLMGKVLARTLELHNMQECREALSWPQRDKLSSQWLLNLPGHNSTLSADEFSQAFSVTLCLPSPACADPLRLGQRVGRRTLDKYGDNAAGQTLAGDGFRTRHDEMKRELLSLMRWAGLGVQCEVFNLFAGLIPQQGLARLERGRKRQGMVADFMVKLPGEAVGVMGAAGSVAVLAELKCISSCPTWYQRGPGVRVKGVDKRANELPGEYRRKAQRLDREFGGVPQGEEGPVARKLASFPPLQSWVFGAWNEASPDIHSLVHHLATARLGREAELVDGGAVARRRRMSSEGALAMITGQIRRRLSLTAARANARLILDRVQVLGEGAEAAGARRRLQAVEERRMDREQRAHHLGLMLGRAILRRGDIYLQ